MKERVLRTLLAAALTLTGAAGLACDREDRRDVQEGVNDAEKEVDQADTDGKDD